MCLLLAQMALMGLSWPLISPMGVKLSTFQTLMKPARQALSSIGRPGTKARAHTQSLWALGICCGRVRDDKVSEKGEGLPRGRHATLLLVVEEATQLLTSVAIIQIEPG